MSMPLSHKRFTLSIRHEPTQNLRQRILAAKARVARRSVPREALLDEIEAETYEAAGGAAIGQSGKIRR